MLAALLLWVLTSFSSALIPERWNEEELALSNPCGLMEHYYTQTTMMPFGFLWDGGVAQQQQLASKCEVLNWTAVRSRGPWTPPSSPPPERLQPVSVFVKQNGRKQSETFNCRQPERTIGTLPSDHHGPSEQ